MIKRTKILVPLIVLAFVFSLLLVPEVTWAHAGHDHTAASDEFKERAQEKAQKLQELREAAAKERAEAIEKAKERLSDAQTKRHKNFQKACEARHDAYIKKLGSVNERVKKHVDTLDTIVDRVDTFVTTKNLTVPNYAALLAEAKTQRELVRTLHQALVEKAEAFECGNSPDEAKAALAAFKDAFNQEVDALKAYKTAVKNLLTTVKATAQEGDGDEN